MSIKLQIEPGDADMPKLTQEEMHSLLENMLNTITSLTQQFLIDQENKPEWESSSVTLEHIKTLKTELLEIPQLPEFTEYGFESSPLTEAIITGFDKLERSITQHSSKIQNNISKTINGYLDSVKNDEAHLISQQELNTIKIELSNLKISKKIKISLEANLRVIEAQILRSHLKLTATNQAIEIMSKMLENYQEKLQVFHTGSKKQSSKEIGSMLLKNLMETTQGLKTSSLEDKVKHLQKAETAIAQALAQRQAQQSKSKSHVIFVSPDKVTLEKVLEAIKKDRSEWTRLLEEVNQAQPKTMMRK